MISNEKKEFIKQAIARLEYYFGTCERAEKWLYVKNPNFGYISPIEMFNLGKGDKVLRWIEDAEENWNL